MRQECCAALMLFTMHFIPFPNPSELPCGVLMWAFTQPVHELVPSIRFLLHMISMEIKPFPDIKDSQMCTARYCYIDY